MATKLLRDLCNNMRHIVVQGHNHWSDGASGEYVCQPAGRLLQGSRDIMHKNIDNSFVWSSMVMKFLQRHVQGQNLH